MEKYDVSIIVPVYNREELIRPCINSINAQTYDKSKWEVIFVDDGSTDRSVEVIEELIDKRINYRIIKREIPSGNASAPRNEGIKASQAKYVFFLDSDDYIDSQLLENGCAMAFKNDSDIVYFKMHLNDRIVTRRPFKVPFVDNADIFRDHLLRTLTVFKMFRLNILRENNVLFDMSINVREDQIFCFSALMFSKNISILADKDYYYADFHSGSHLSRQKTSIHSLLQIGYRAITLLYCTEKDLDIKIKFYNALLIRVVEALVEFSKKRKIEDKELLSNFEMLSKIFCIHKEFFDLPQIYKNEQILTLLFLSGDFKSFYKASREVKVSEALKTLLESLQKVFEKTEGFQKAWIYDGKIAVLDFVCRGHRIAFDVELNEKSKEIKVWMFCRDNVKFFENEQKRALKVNGNKLLVFEGDKADKAIGIIGTYLDNLK